MKNSRPSGAIRQMEPENCSELQLNHKKTENDSRRF